MIKMRSLLSILTTFAIAGCFSMAPLPGADVRERNRAWASVSPVDNEAYLWYLKRSFYGMWLAEYGPVLPPTLSSAVTADPSTMAGAEGPVSALLVLQISPTQSAAIAPSMSTQEYWEFRDMLRRYQAPLEKRISRVGSRIAAAAGRSDLVFILEPSLGLNAATPNTFNSHSVLVGPQLALLLDDDSELAAVLGHEVAHITKGHTSSAAAWNVAINVAQVAVAISVARRTGSSAQAAAAADLTGLATRGTLLAVGYDRDHERDADYYGLQYAAQAGYEPLGGLSAFMKLARVEKGQGGSTVIPFLADHPGTDERLVRLTKQVSRVKGGDFSAGGLYCWRAPAGSGECRSCCTTTSYCVSDCD